MTVYRPRGRRWKESWMGTRVRVGVVLAASALLAGLVGMQTATGQTALHLVLPAETNKVREVDSSGPGLRLGDRVAARGQLTDGQGTTMGTAYADCVVHRRITSPETGLWTCNY